MRNQNIRVYTNYLKLWTCIKKQSLKESKLLPLEKEIGEEFDRKSPHFLYIFDL